MEKKAKTIDISEQELNTLFGNADQLLNVNFTLLERIVEKFEQWDSDTSTIADLFGNNPPLGMGPYLKMYKSFANSAYLGLEFLKKEGKNRKELVKYFAQLQKEEVSKNLDFTSYYTTPITRIPRYKSLLETLEKYTNKVNPDHPEVDQIKIALTVITEVADAVNKAVDKKGEEMMTLFMKLNQLNPKFMGNKDFEFLTPTREFVKEMEVSQKQDKKNKLVKCNLYIFNDLILGTPKKQGWWHMDLVNCDLQDIDPLKFLFGITATLPNMGTPTKSMVTLGCQSAAEKTELMKLLRDNITKAKENQPKRGVKSVPDTL